MGFGISITKITLILDKIVLREAWLWDLASNLAPFKSNEIVQSISVVVEVEK